MGVLEGRAGGGGVGGGGGGIKGDAGCVSPEHHKYKRLSLTMLFVNFSSLLLGSIFCEAENSPVCWEF